MNTVSMTRRLRRLVPHLAAAAFIVFASNAHAASSCGPSGQAGVERCVAGVSSATLMGMQQMQEASNWCWAASISMLLRRYGVEVPQRDIVQAQLGRIDNVRIAVDAMARLLDRRWSDAQGRSLVASVEPLPAWRMRLGVLAPEILEDLAQEKPVMLAADKHALLLVQVVYDRLPGGSGKPDQIELVRGVVLDPSSPGGLRSLRASEKRPDMLARVHANVQPLRPLAANRTETALALPADAERVLK